MAKKPILVRTRSSASQTEIRDDVEVVHTKNPLARRTGEGRGEGDGGRLQRPLLDTRIVYCGDNLEPAGRMQKEEGRMMKPAHSPILHSSFILLNFSLPASHYVKVMLDQILGGVIETAKYAEYAKRFWLFVRIFRVVRGQPASAHMGKFNLATN
jgi:hypothetical protein